jgi:HEAT repeat protein
MIVALPLIKYGDSYIQEHAVMMLCEMADKSPELFEPLSILAADANAKLRSRAVQSMRSFGTRGLPILQRAFDDADKGVRQMAIRTAGDMAKTAEPLIPILRTLRDEDDPEIRYDIASAMHRISPETYPRPDRPIPNTR